jgi:hypothetical protein
MLDTLDSEHSRRAYRRALVDFLDWHADRGRPDLNKALVQRYAAELREAASLQPTSTSASRLSANSLLRRPTTARSTRPSPPASRP